MLEVKGQTIYMTRGDSIRFAMKKKVSDDSEILAMVEIPTNTLLLEIEPSVTEGLAYNKYGD